MSKFEAHLKNLIRQNGPMDVATFMGLALGHYYATRDPFGVKGDFTTAPEISQMFGEMIGVCLADVWQKTGSPERITLVEAGPGRGTLMADLLRATRNVPGFHQAVRLHLIEMSPVLKEKQRDTLRDFQVTWHETLDTLPQDAPVFLVANEFLDALPVQHYVWKDARWHWRVIGLDKDDGLVFGLTDCPPPASPPHEPGEGAIWEHSPARESFVKNTALLIRRCGGVALLIDYGHDRSGFGDTLQAVKDHRFVNVLEQVGEADLTSHVDFEPLKNAAQNLVTVHGPVGQGDFLNRLGIGLRAGRLGQPEACHRLSAPDQMGTLFRVMALCHDPEIEVAGFS